MAHSVQHRVGNGFVFAVNMTDQQATETLLNNIEGEYNRIRVIKFRTGGNDIDIGIKTVLP